MAVVRDKSLANHPSNYAPGNTTSGAIIHALQRRHSDAREVCLTEVELGRSGRRADFYTSQVSWDNSMATCYEIKVSRADFKRDKKWHLYLPYCVRFYFACPAGLLTSAEMPPEAGLVWVDDMGTVAIIKNAPHRKMKRSHKLGMMRRLLHRYMICQGSLIQPGEKRPVE